MLFDIYDCLLQTISHQFKIDKKVFELVRVMEDAFNFVHEADFLRDKTKYLKSTMIGLLKQVDECCIFVREYAQRTFAGVSEINIYSFETHSA